MRVILPEKPLDECGRRLIRRRALLAVAPRETLRQHAQHRRVDRERRTFEIAQTRDRARRVIRVQRGKHEVPGHRGLNGDPGRLFIADLPQQDHVRILAENRAQRLGEPQPDLAVHLNVPNHRQPILDRVFDRHQVAVRRVHQRQGGIQRRGLARAGRPGCEDHAIWLRCRVLEQAYGLRRATQLREASHRQARAQQTHHNVLAPDRREHAQADVDGSTVADIAKLAVLRPARLRQVEIRHDLDPLDDAAVARQRRPLHAPQRPVDPVSQVQLVLVRADVNVRRTRRHRLADDLIHRRHNRLVVGPQHRVGSGVGRVRLRLVILVRPVRSYERVRALDQGSKRDGLTDHRVDVRLEQASKPIDPLKIHRVDHAHGRQALEHEQRKRVKLPRHRSRNQPRVGQINIELRQVGVRAFAHARAGHRQLPRREDLQIDERVQHAAIRFGHARPIDRLGRHQALLGQSAEHKVLVAKHASPPRPRSPRPFA